MALATTAYSGAHARRDTAAGVLHDTLEAHGDIVTAVAWSPGGARLASAAGGRSSSCGSSACPRGRTSRSPLALALSGTTRGPGGDRRGGRGAATPCDAAIATGACSRRSSGRAPGAACARRSRHRDPAACVPGRHRWRTPVSPSSGCGGPCPCEVGRRCIGRQPRARRGRPAAAPRLASPLPFDAPSRSFLADSHSVGQGLRGGKLA